MRSRIRGLVSEQLQTPREAPGQVPTPGPLPHPEPGPAYWREVLAGLEGARIGTIHSFCAELLRAPRSGARTRGLLVHRWLEEVEWLEDFAFDEARLLNVAHRFQQATDWHQRHAEVN